MKFFCATIIFTLVSFNAFTQGVGINVSSPQSMLDIEGNVSIGSAYSGTTPAPVNGMIVEGDIGVGTTNPDQTFHVHKASAGAATSFGNAVATFENNGPAYLQILAPNGDARGILFGDPTSSLDGGILYNGGVTDGLEFRTNGNTTRMTITSGGNVGINTTNPGDRLHVVGDVRLVGPSTTTGPGGHLVFQGNRTAHIWLDDQLDTQTPNQADLYFSLQSGAKAFNFGHSSSLYTKAAFVNWVTINSGRLGIGSNNPSQVLDVVGNGTFTGTVTASCGVLTCSDERYKKNINPIENALESVRQINGVTYDWKSDDFPEKGFNDKKQIGILAQEVETIFPSMVYTGEDGYKTVDYTRLTPVLIEAIKELTIRLEKLENDN